MLKYELDIFTTIRFCRKKSGTISRVMLSLILCCGAVLFASCGSKQPLPTDEQRLAASKRVPCVVVLPAVAAVDNDSNMTYQQAAELEKGAGYMNTMIVDAMVGHNNVRVLTEHQVTSLIPTDSASRMALFKKVGSVVKCRGVMVTTLNRYRQRVGGRYGADLPASVSFTMRLYDTSSGTMIWVGQFEETQQSFLSNIISGVHRGFKWLTAEQLLKLGIEETIRKCPYI